MENKYPIDLNGKTYQLSEKVIGELIKKRMKQSKVIMGSFSRYGLPVEILDQLIIVIKPLEDQKKYAESDGEKMILCEKIFEKGDFFRNWFFVPAHEIFHVICRNAKVQTEDQDKEENFLKDPEEIDAFILAIAYEREKNTDPQIIWERIFPKISFHFRSDCQRQAKDLFEKMVEEAIEIYKNC